MKKNSKSNKKAAVKRGLKRNKREKKIKADKYIRRDKLLEERKKIADKEKKEIQKFLDARNSDLR